MCAEFFSKLAPLRIMIENQDKVPLGFVEFDFPLFFPATADKLRNGVPILFDGPLLAQKIATDERHGRLRRHSESDKGEPEVGVRISLMNRPDYGELTELEINGMLDRNHSNDSVLDQAIDAHGFSESNANASAIQRSNDGPIHQTDGTYSPVVSWLYLLNRKFVNLLALGALQRQCYC